MQIEFQFSCRECGADTRITWDTSHSGELEELFVLTSLYIICVPSLL